MTGWKKVKRKGKRLCCKVHLKMGEIYGLATWFWLLFDVSMKTISFTRNIGYFVKNYLLEARRGQLDFIFNGVESSPDYLVASIF